MSCSSFSQKLTKDMYNKLQALENNDYDYLLNFDDNFCLALSLAYLVISKEKFIEKDKDDYCNQEGRLTCRVDEAEIDKLFSGKYADMIDHENCDVKYNNVWYLDVIRDCVAHGKIDIDEDNKVIKFNNTKDKRRFIAEIPFEWFSDYLKADLFNKKTNNNFYYRGFYYNNYQNKDICYIKNPSKAVKNNILYRVDIKGVDVPITEVSNLIEELMAKYSREIKVFNELDDAKGSYEKYYMSFSVAKTKLYTELKKLYPEANINVVMDNHRYKLQNKAKKELLDRYRCYDDLYQDLNGLLKNKSISLLNTFKSVYELAELSSDELLDLPMEEKFKKLVNIIDNKKPSPVDDYFFDKSNYVSVKQAIYLLLLQVYGVSTIVINIDNLTDQDYLDYLDGCCFAYVNNSENRTNTRRGTINDYLGSRRSYIESFRNLRNHMSEFNYNKFIDSKKEYKRAKKAYDELEDSLIYTFPGSNISKGIEFTTKQGEIIKKIKNKVNEYDEDCLNKDSNVKVIEKEIKKLFEELYALEDEFYVCLKTNPEESLILLRNCFAHIGRINKSKYYDMSNNKLKLTDYKDLEFSGRVSFRYMDLIEAIDYFSDCCDNKVLTK